MRISQIHERVRSYTSFYCPDCGEKMRFAYMVDQVLVCEKCQKVYELHYRKSPLTIKQIKEDGWLR